MQETWLQSLGHVEPLEKVMATQSSILAWEIPWTEEPGKAPTVLGVEKTQTVWATKHKHNWLDETLSH